MPAPMTLEMAVAILEENILKPGPKSFDELGRLAVAWAAETVIAMAQANRDASVQASEATRLRLALLHARVAVESWGAYADDYFKQKHDLAGDIAAIDAALTLEPAK